MIEPSSQIEPRKAREETPEPSKQTAEILIAGSTTEALAGAGAGVLAILGLLGVLPPFMAAIATIALGGALIIEGASIASRMQRLGNGTRYLASGLTVESLGGATGVVLGILALVGLEPWTLMPVAAIVMSGAILIGAGAEERIENVIHDRLPRDNMHQAVNATQGARVLVGLGVGTLGVIVLAGVGAPIVLTLVALLALGAAELLFGSAFGARMGRALRR